MKHNTLTRASLWAVLLLPLHLFGQSHLCGDTLHLTLSNALEIALSQSSTIKIAELEVQRVDYSRKEAWGNILPVVNSNLQYTNNVMKPVMFVPESFSVMMGGQSYMEIGSKNSYSANISAGVPLFNFSLWENIQSKDIDLSIALEKARSSRISLTKSVKNTYYRLLLSTYTTSVFEETYKNALQTLQHTEKAYEAGAVSEYDLVRAQVQVGNLKPNLITAKNNTDLSAMQLKILLGLDMRFQIYPSEQFGGFDSICKTISLDTLHNLSNNSNLRQLDLNIAKTNSQLRLVNSKYLPSLNAFGQFGYQTQSEDFKFKDYRWVSSAAVGLQLSIPIMSGLTRHHQRKQLQTVIQTMEYQRLSLNDNLAMGLSAAINNMLSAREQISSAQNAVAQAERGLKIAHTRYEVGTGTILELNDSEMSLLQAKLNYTQALYQYLTARNEYEEITAEQ